MRKDVFFAPEFCRAFPPAGEEEASVAGAGCSRLAAILLRVSFVCAFLSIALLSFDVFPYRLVGRFHPRPSYIVSLLGMACWLAALRWPRQMRRHAVLLGLVGTFALYGLTVSLINAARLEGQGLLVFTAVNFLERQVGPLAYILWFASLLSPLKEEDARRFFIAALVAMFLPNAAHMALELLANYGAGGIKDFLIAVNPWFREEHTLYGTWPPPYYEARVRGLFGEPAHLAYAVTPLLAFFFYKLRQKRLWYAAPLLLIGVSYLGALPTMTGLISLGFLGFGFLAHCLYACFPGRARAVSAVLALGVLVCLGAGLYLKRDSVAEYVQEWNGGISALADYCRKAQTGAAELPELEGDASRFFTRMLSTRLEMDIALQHPLTGMGYQLSGLYRKPLGALRGNGGEAFVKVRYALREPIPEFPYFCEYTGMAAELGFPGLALFLLICAYVGLGAYRRYRATGDMFVLYMLLVLPAFLFMMISFALRTCYITYYFLGFLYVIGADRKAASAPGAGGRPHDGGVAKEPSGIFIAP